MISILSGALAPSLALLSYIYLKDKYESEPIKLIMKMFILGSLLVFPSYVLERTFYEGLSEIIFLIDIFSIGVIEEFLKWFVIYFMIYKHVEFNEPYDGIVYSVSVGIGFATIENIGYLIFNSYSPLFGLLRAFLPVSSHTIFGVIMGYYLGVAKFSSNIQNINKKNAIIKSLILPILMHSLYNLILSLDYPDWIYFILLFLIIGWIVAFNKIRIASKLSPFKE